MRGGGGGGGGGGVCACACACVCVCVCARVRVCVCACVCACMMLYIQRAPSRQGVHWPQLSCLKKDEIRATTLIRSCRRCPGIMYKALAGLRARHKLDQVLPRLR